MTRMERFKAACKADAKAFVESGKSAPMPKWPEIVEMTSGHFVAPPAK